MKTLILGGARSGKSSRAEDLATNWPHSRVYVGTWRRELGEDAEMEARIRHHHERRGTDWTTVDAGDDLAGCLRQSTGHMLVDCLTVWLGGVLAGGATDDALTRRLEDLEAAVHDIPGSLVLVSNELGLGLVPPDAESRRFRDWHGRMNQRVAASCDRVEFLAAGLPLILKEKT